MAVNMVYSGIIFSYKSAKTKQKLWQNLTGGENTPTAETPTVGV